jgi:hypothetical protein
MIKHNPVTIKRDGDTMFVKTIGACYAKDIGKFQIEMKNIGAIGLPDNVMSINASRQADVIALCIRYCQHDGEKPVEYVSPSETRDELGCLPLTKGTAKQKAWADALRLKMLADYKNPVVLQNLKNCKDAVKIIENRNNVTGVFGK